MKKLFSLIGLFILLISASQAQGNLQFNRAVRLEWTATIASNSVTSYTFVGLQPFNVPVGKVWKIESMNISLNKSNLPFNTTDPQVLLNGSQVNEPPVLFLNNTAVHVNGEVATPGITKHQIMWLPDGNYDFQMAGRPSTTFTQEFSILVTAIEFNIVP